MYFYIYALITRTSLFFKFASDRLYQFYHDHNKFIKKYVVIALSMKNVYTTKRRNQQLKLGQRSKEMGSEVSPSFRTQPSPNSLPDYHGSF